MSRRSAPWTVGTMRETGRVDIEAVAQELYGLPPHDFIAARNDHSKQARADGDRGAAAEIQAMRKPTTAAWLVNHLTRHHGDEVRLLLDLGAELRAGLTGVDGEDLRLLTRRRYQLVSALVQQARAAAADQARRVSDEVLGGVRTTLESTLADAESASLVASGCLVDVLEVSGFGLGFAPGDEPQLEPAPAVDTSSPVADLDERRRLRDKQVKQAAADVSSAEVAAREAHDCLDGAQGRLSDADEQRDESASVVKRLTEELARANAALDEADAIAQECRSGQESAATSVRRADRELTDAKARLRKLKR